MWPIKLLYLVMLLSFIAAGSGLIYLEYFRSPPARGVGDLAVLTAILGGVTLYLAGAIAEKTSVKSE